MSEIGVPHHVQKEEHKRVGVFIAALAVVMALISALANNQANQVIVKEVESSNGFAWYQAKRQRTYVNEIEIQHADFALAGALTDGQRKLIEQTKARLKTKNVEYEREGEGIQAKAKADSAAAELAKHKHHWLEYGEVCTHIAVVLCSLTLLTDARLFFRLGIAATIAGILIGSLAFFLPPHADHTQEEKSAPAAMPAAASEDPHSPLLRGSYASVPTASRRLRMPCSPKRSCNPTTISRATPGPSYTKPV
jgi:Domain of unknown function (DUF4337)